MHYWMDVITIKEKSKFKDLLVNLPYEKNERKELTERMHKTMHFLKFQTLIEKYKILIRLLKYVKVLMYFLEGTFQNVIELMKKHVQSFEFL